MQEENQSIEKCYVGCKIIRASKMTQHHFINNFLHLNKSELIDKLDSIPDGHGYHVHYPDVNGDGGYHSWSPKEVFELSYRELTEGEAQSI